MEYVGQNVSLCSESDLLYSELIVSQRGERDNFTECGS